MEAYRNVTVSNCVDEWLLQHYINGHLPQTERERIERHLCSCEMCTDEIEGMKLISEHKRKASVEKLEEKLYKKYINSGKSRRLTGWVIAAACVAGILGTVVFYFNKPADIDIPVAEYTAPKSNEVNEAGMGNTNNQQNNVVVSVPQEEKEQDENIEEVNVAVEVPDVQEEQQIEIEEETYIAENEETEAPAFELNEDADYNGDDSILLALNEEPNFEDAGITRGKKLVEKTEKSEFEIQLEKYMKDSSNCLLVQRLLDMAQNESNEAGIIRFSTQIENLHCNE